jgi:hypothetical protein
MSTDKEHPPATSMHERTLADLDHEYSAKGRWGGHDRPTITSGGPAWAPPAIKGTSPWTDTDPVPNEEPLGYAVDELPDVSGIDRAQLTPTDEEPTEP